jgi:hypothetical protein
VLLFPTSPFFAHPPTELSRGCVSDPRARPTCTCYIDWVQLPQCLLTVPEPYPVWGCSAHTSGCDCSRVHAVPAWAAVCRPRVDLQESPSIWESNLLCCVHRFPSRGCVLRVQGWWCGRPRIVPASDAVSHWGAHKLDHHRSAPSIGAARSDGRGNCPTGVEVDSVELSVGWSHVYQTRAVGVDAKGHISSACVCRA